MSNAHFVRRVVTGMLAATLALLVSFSLGACRQNDEKAIRERATQILEAVKNPTKENLAPYMEDMDDETTQMLDSYGVDIYEFFGHAFKHFDYSIGEIKVNGNKATVDITTKNANLDSAIEVASQKFEEEVTQDDIIALYSDGGEKAVTQKFFTYTYQALDDSTDIKKTSVTLNFIKTDGEWEVDDSSMEDFLSTLYGGADFSDTE
ncbi:hypothetical protein [Olsenella sp. HMSC062G07]|uniref:hypothetical protein n=1 Tax=Olsenella sp. HMSC062G07 TaxID=1739330 RepID=UPI0008A619F7|nr:hypothetical protein [Olsenella sp. HMSC062G07]OFK24351.1 hypothetical protein HMPREF2826_07945 [Olsenella sp. HMSC062G07]